MSRLSQQHQRLLSSSTSRTESRTPDPPSINSDLPETENAGASALKVYWKELTSGQYRLSTLLLYSLVASLGSLLMGITLGYTSVTQLSLANTTTEHNIHSPTKTEFEWFGMLANLGALLGGPMAGLLSDRLGRKMTLLLGGLPSTLGWLLVAYSYIPLVDIGGTFEEFYSLLLVGRFFTGVSMGWYSLIVPVYVVELSPASLKGLFGSLCQLAVTCGIFLVYILGTWFLYHTVALIVLGIVVVQVMLVAVVLDETPRYLVANGRDKEAESVLRKVYGYNECALRQLKELRVSIGVNHTQGSGSLLLKLRLLQRKVILIPFVLSILLMFFQQFSGINAIVFYSGDILSSGGVKHPQIMADLGIGVIQVLATLLAVMVMDFFGRKVLLVAGSICMATSTTLVGVYFLVTECICQGGASNSSNFSYCNPIQCVNLDGFYLLPVLSLALFVCGFSLGWGPIPWFMMSELLPMRVRGILCGIATATNWTFSAIVTGAFFSYQTAVGNHFCFWTFSVIIIASIPVVVLFLPETKGKNLATIQLYFEKKYTTMEKIAEDYS